MLTQTFGLIELDKFESLLHRMEEIIIQANPKPETSPLDKYKDHNTTAQKLGISPFTLYAIPTDELPRIKKGKKCFYLEEDILRYMNTPNIPKVRREKKEFLHNELPG